MLVRNNYGRYYDYYFSLGSIRIDFTEDGTNYYANIDEFDGWTYVEVDYGTTVTLTPTGIQGYTFKGWSSVSGITGVSNVAPLSFQMPGQDVYVQADYASSKSFTVKIADGPAENGSGKVSVTISGQTTVLSTDGVKTRTFTVAEGAKVSVVAEPAAGSVFRKWDRTNQLNIGNDRALSLEFTIPAQNNQTLTAKFAQPTTHKLKIHSDSDQLTKITVQYGDFKKTYTTYGNTGKIVEIEVMEGTEITITAEAQYHRWRRIIWKKEPNDITFDTSDGGYGEASTKILVMPEKDVKITVDTRRDY